ncbi:uncharacterized protein LOC114340126 [Diabrotica virgifera virgifera]|uniref:Uncharacterized protein LOC114340126 n=1 Tax=Diabrotica virgifera virgifera TaxID=50390 RepID=A0A6P7GBD8_DIAVI|nr:uncharacterized protein LOC114340126 [Diabrotica virgifera virgifera]
MAMRRLNLVALLLISGLTVIVSQQKEIVMDEDIPILKADKHIAYINNVPVEEIIPCHMEIQDTKEVVGTCVRLGRATRGCAAGNYLQPLHPQCL